MSEFDELVSRDGVIVAGRLGPDWRIAEHKSVGLLIEDPRVFELMSSFAAAIQTIQHDGSCHERRCRGELATGEGLGRFDRPLLGHSAR